MLLHLYYLPSPFSIKTLDSSRNFYFPSPSLPSSQNPNNKSNKSFICCSSSSTKRAELATKTAIYRIAEKLRSLGYIEEENSKQNQQEIALHGSPGEIFLPSSEDLPNQRVGHTIDTSWTTPENPVPKPGSGAVITNFHKVKREVEKKKRFESKKEERVPSLAELSVPEEELKRLISIGIPLKKKLKVGKAGVTEGIVNGIHERWRRAEVVKLKCEDISKMNMKRTHDILERKTGGLVVWRSGSTVILYRGTDYKFPYFLTDDTLNGTSHDESDSTTDYGFDGEKEHSLPSPINRIASTSLVHGVGFPNRVRFQLPGEAELAEEADRLLDGLGPRFTDWWGYDPQPIDADLLPALVDGYRRPFRLLPYGIQPKLTDDEMTTLRRLSRPLPIHFALGRNRRLKGLAAAIVKLWKKCEIAKIAVKRGVQNTNSELMAKELKQLTGGTLISRDREFIVIYRGKDFLPPAVSTAIEERRKPRKLREERGIDKSSSTERSPALELRVNEPISAIELQQSNDQMERGPVTEQRKLNSISAERIPELESRAKEPISATELQQSNDQKERGPVTEQRKLNTAIETISIKLSLALEKKEKAEQLLAELEKAEQLQKPEFDREGITEEERYMLKRVGLRMKPFLLLGRRGVFAGTVENMHLHWKYRELVKIIISARCIEDAFDVAKTLEAESGGILVAVERISRAYAIIVYRGKNYQRPTDLRPRTLLTKRQALKRSLEAQRRKSLKLHVLKLNNNIDQLKHQLVKEDMEINHEKSTEYSKKITDFEAKDHLGTVDYSQNQSKARSVESTRSQVVLEGYGSESTSLHSDYNEEATHLDKLMTWSSQYSEPAETLIESSSEPVMRETQSNSFHNDIEDGSQDDSAFCSENSLSQGGATCSLIDTADFHVTDHESTGSSIQSSNNELDSVHREKVEKDIHGAFFRAQPLSNRDRLILRKQALKMKKHPLLAIGSSNVVTGVAKAIKTHFKKHPLAIVNVKGRAKGTSVQELIFKLEQATGAVMVSQEPSKVILYRGWREEAVPQCLRSNKRNARTSGSGIRGSRNVVSPELMAAIRLECGLSDSKEEKKNLD